MHEQQCRAIKAEFPGFQVRTGVNNNWQARRVGWKAAETINASDADDMRRKLTIWTKENANHE